MGLIAGLASAQLACAPVLAGDAASPTLTVCYPDFPPFSYADPEGRPAGHLMTLFAEMTAITGDRFRPACVPARRLARWMLTGACTVAMVVRSLPGWRTGVLTSPTPIDRMVLRVYAIGHPPAVARATDLFGRRVIARLGFSYAGLRPLLSDAANGVEVVHEARTAVQGLRLLEAGRAELLLDYENNIDAVLARRPVAGLRSVVLKTVPIYLNISRQAPDPAGLMRRLVAAHRRVTAHR